MITNSGKNLHNHNSNNKFYWKIINTLLKKCKASKIPPLLVNNLFIINCKEKAKLFTDFCSQQCKPVINDSFLPDLSLLTNERIEQIPIESKAISSLIRQLNPNKATGSDGISPPHTSVM